MKYRPGDLVWFSCYEKDRQTLLGVVIRENLDGLVGQHNYDILAFSCRSKLCLEDQKQECFGSPLSSINETFLSPLDNDNETS
jgi:hypothetical protein